MSVNVTVRANTSSMQRDVFAAVDRINRSGKLKINIDDKGVTQPLGNMKRSADEFTKSLEASNSRVIAFGASVMVINAVGDAFKGLVKATIEVEKHLANINVVMGLSTQQLDKFSGGLFKVARETAQSFDTASEAATEFARQGLSVEETLKRTRDAMILTRLTGMGAADSVKNLTAAMNTFGHQVKDSTELVSKFAAVDVKFAVSAEDFAQAISRAGASAKSAGVDLNEFIGMVTAAQQQTARGGAVIGNSLKTIFTRIQKPETLRQLENVGIAVKDLEGRTIGAKKILTDLANTFDTLTDAQRAQVAQSTAGIFQINILKAILGDAAKANGIQTEATRISSQATDQAIQKNAILSETFTAAYAEAGLAVEELAKKIGDLALAPGIGKVLETVKGAADWMSGLIGEGEEGGNTFAKGFLTGIGNVLTGPGLIIFAAVVGKLFMNAFKFAKDSLKSVLGITTETQKQKQIQQSLLMVLAQNSAVQSELLAKGVSRSQQEKIILGVIQQQTAEAAKLQSLAASLAPGLSRAGVGANLSAGRGSRAAGYIPNYAADGPTQERREATKGGYVAGTIKQGPGFLYNSRETLKKFPGMRETAIMPPENSKAGANYRTSFFAQHGKDPYAAQGYVPNFSKRSFLVGKRPNAVKKDLTIDEARRAGISEGTIEGKFGKDYKSVKGPAKSFSSQFEKMLTPGFMNKNYKGKDDIWMLTAGDSKGGMTTRPFAGGAAGLLLKKVKANKKSLTGDHGGEITTHLKNINAARAIEGKSTFTGPSFSFMKSGSGIQRGGSKTLHKAISTELNDEITKLYKKFLPNKEPWNKKTFKMAAEDQEEQINQVVGRIFENILLQGIGAKAGSASARMDIPKDALDAGGGAPRKTLEELYGVKIREAEIKHRDTDDSSASFLGKLLETGGLTGGKGFDDVSTRVKGIQKMGSAAAKFRKAHKFEGTKALGFIPNFAAASLAKFGGLGESKFKLAALIKKSPFRHQLTRYGHWNNFPPDVKKRLHKWLLKTGLTNRALQGYGFASAHGADIAKGINDLAVAGGHVPNFADPLSNAIGRERAAGVPVSQIRVGTHAKLMNRGNPMGVGVTNTTDEPRGLRDVLGAAHGSVPNFAMPTISGSQKWKDNLQKDIDDQEKLIEKENKEIKKLTKTQEDLEREIIKERKHMEAYRKQTGRTHDDLRKNDDAYRQANNEVTKLKRRQKASGRKLIDSENRLTTAQNQKAKQIKKQAGGGMMGKMGGGNLGMVGMMGMPMLGGMLTEGSKEGSFQHNLGSSMTGAASGAMMGMMIAPILGPLAPFAPVIGGAIGAVKGFTDAMEKAAANVRKAQVDQITIDQAKSIGTASNILETLIDKHGGALESSYGGGAPKRYGRTAWNRVGQTIFDTQGGNDPRLKNDWSGKWGTNAGRRLTKSQRTQWSENSPERSSAALSQILFRDLMDQPELLKELKRQGLDVGDKATLFGKRGPRDLDFTAGGDSFGVGATKQFFGVGGMPVPKKDFGRGGKEADWAAQRQQFLDSLGLFGIESSSNRKWVEKLPKTAAFVENWLKNLGLSAKHLAESMPAKSLFELTNKTSKTLNDAMINTSEALSESYAARRGIELESEKEGGDRHGKDISNRRIANRKRIDDLEAHAVRNLELFVASMDNNATIDITDPTGKIRTLDKKMIEAESKALAGSQQGADLARKIADSRRVLSKKFLQQREAAIKTLSFQNVQLRLQGRINEELNIIKEKYSLSARELSALGKGFGSMGAVRKAQLKYSEAMNKASGTLESSLKKNEGAHAKGVLASLGTSVYQDEAKYAFDKTSPQMQDLMGKGTYSFSESLKNALNRTAEVGGEDPSKKTTLSLDEALREGVSIGDSEKILDLVKARMKGEKNLALIYDKHLNQLNNANDLAQYAYDISKKDAKAQEAISKAVGKRVEGFKELARLSKITAMNQAAGKTDTDAKFRIHDVQQQIAGRFDTKAIARQRELGRMERDHAEAQTRLKEQTAAKQMKILEEHKKTGKTFDFKTAAEMEKRGDFKGLANINVKDDQAQLLAMEAAQRNLKEKEKAWSDAGGGGMWGPANADTLLKNAIRDEPNQRKIVKAMASLPPKDPARVAEEDKLKEITKRRFNLQALKDAVTETENMVLTDQERKKILDDINERLRKNVAAGQQELQNAENLNKEKIKQKELEGPGSFSDGMRRARSSIGNEMASFQETLGHDVTYAFRDGMVAAMEAAIYKADDLGSALKGVAAGFLEAINKALLTHMANSVISGLGLGGLRSGGPVKGYASGGKVNAKVSDGEFLMSGGAVKKYGTGFMNSVNSGSVPGFAKGGEFSPYEQKQRGERFKGRYTKMPVSSHFLATNENVQIGEDRAFAKSEAQRLLQEELADRQEDAQLMRSILTMAASAAVSAGISAASSAGSAGAGEVGKSDVKMGGKTYKVQADGSYKSPAGNSISKTHMQKAFTAKGNQAALPMAGGFQGPRGGAPSFEQPSWWRSMKMAPAYQSMFNTENFYGESYDKGFSRMSQVGAAGGWDQYQEARERNASKKREHADGGLISGQGGVDNIPAMLTEGEYVIRGDSVRKLGLPTLNAINAGKFAQGGPTSNVGEGTASKAGDSTNNINITVNVENNQEGETKSESDGSNEEDGRQMQELGKMIKEKVLVTIHEEQRPGGLLAK